MNPTLLEVLGAMAAVVGIGLILGFALSHFINEEDE